MNQKLLKLSLAVSAMVALSCGPAQAHPYASGITNDNGTIRFILNEGGGNVDVVFEDSSTYPMGVVPKGATNFLLGAHTSFSITVTKVGNGIPSLISDNAFSNSIWANPRGVAVNKNPKNGHLFGRAYIGSAGTGGFAFGTPGFKPQGVLAYNADQSEIAGMGVGTGTNSAAKNIFTNAIDGVGFAGSSPWRIRVAADDTVLVNDSTVAGNALFQFTPDLSSAIQMLAGRGRVAGQAAGTHGGNFGTPIVTGSIAEGNMVLWTADCQLGAPASATLGPATSPGSFNCIFRYDIGAGPLPWNSPPNFAYTMGLDGIPGLRTEMTLGNDGKIMAGFGRANGSNPCLQILDPTGQTWLYTGGINPPANQGPPGVDPWAGINGSGTVNGTYAGIRVSPDGRFIASVDLNNGVTMANLTNGIPDEASLVGIVNAPGTGNSRGMDWDIANNLYIASSGQGLVRVYSLGLTTTCVTSNDWTGTNGSFNLTLPPVTASVNATTPLASQNYGTPIPGVFRISLNVSTLAAPLTINFTRTGTAAYTNHYTINTNETPNGVIINTNSVTFPAGTYAGANGPNWNVDVKIIPTALPVSTNTLTVVLQVLGGAGNVAGAPARGTVFIQNTGPQLLLMTAAASGTSMYRGVTNDYAKFVITRLGDTNGPNNSVGNINPLSYTVTNVTYFGTAVYPTDYKARAQRLDPAGNGALVPPVDGPTAIVINPGDTTVTCAIGNPVRHSNLSLTPTNLTIVLTLTNNLAVGAATTNLTSSENLPYIVGLATTTLTELDNAIGPEVVLWSNPLTNAADSANWTVTFAGTNYGPGQLPIIIPNYVNDFNSVYGGVGSNDFLVHFGEDVFATDGVDPSPVMAANGWTRALKMTVNKNNFAAAGVNAYPQGQNFQGNYALRFNMYLSLYGFAKDNPNIGSAAREFATFGVNHRGTNCNWRTDAPMNTAGVMGPTNWDGIWYAVDAGAGSSSPADFDMLLAPTLPNNANALNDRASNTSASQNGVFKHPPFDAMNVTTPTVNAPGGGEAVNKWVDVSLEITSQTNMTLFINKSAVIAPTPLTNSASPATWYTNGNIMLGYLDPNANISDGSAYVYFSNVRVVELSPYLITQARTTAGAASNLLVAQFSSLTFTSSATFASAPMTNKWFKGTGQFTNSNVGIPTALLQSNSVNATTFNDSLTYTFNNAADGTNYLNVYSDPAGSVTSRVAAVVVVMGPTNRSYLVGTSNLLAIRAFGPSQTANLQGLTAVQWYFNTSSNLATATKLVNSVNYNGVTSTNLVLTNVLASHDGYYWAAVTNSAGGLVPEAARLIVQVPASPAFASAASSGANIALSFSSPNNFDTTASYYLLQAPVVTGPWTTNNAAVFTGTFPDFVATVARTNDTMFYRLLHK